MGEPIPQQRVLAPEGTYGSGRSSWRSAIVSLALLALGGCVCPAGQASCGDTCSSLLDDVANCGRCGNQCDWRCEAGECVPRPECGPDAARPECDDHDPCNGVEACGLGANGYRCVLTTPPISCNDGVSCTSDVCMSDGTCVSTPSSSGCGTGSTCDLHLGCIRTCSHEGCGLLDGCGCGPQQSCLPSPTGGLATCGTAGARGVGDRCFANDDCEEGAVCAAISVDGTFAMCMAMCGSDADCPGNDPLCIQRGMVSSAEPSVGMCSPICDPVTSAGCPPGSKCSMVRSDSGTRITGCIAPPGAGTSGASCVTHDECGRGLLCIRESASSTVAFCRPWCQVGGVCSTRTCTRLSPAIVLNGVEYGACL